jgi:membrane-bound lytic murein transglycosylase D
LHTVARKYRTSVAYLRDLNDIPKGKRLKVGMKLYVPDRTPVAPKRNVVAKKKNSEPRAPSVGSKVALAGGRFYIVQSGDTLSSIAKKYAISIAQLKRANNIRRGKLLKIGLRLSIPGDAAEKINDDGARMPASSARRAIAIKNKYHVVKRGENLSHIAEKYNVSVSEIKTKNNLKNMSKLFIGAKLLIPEALAAK